MAFPTSVNGQITDAVTQTNIKVVGDTPAIVPGNLDQATAHDATDAQLQSDVIPPSPDAVIAPVADNAG